MEWTERYFMTQYLAGVIICVLILIIGVIVFIGWLIEKIRNKFDQRLAERTERRLNNRKDDDTWHS